MSKESIKLQCFICKKSINIDEINSNSLDPCAVTISSNIDKDKLDQREQTFFCHFECFRKVNNDDGVLYLESLGTPREVQEESNSINDSMENLNVYLYREGENIGLWKKLFQMPKGTWTHLKSLLNCNESEAINLISRLEELIYDKILISWSDDLCSNERSQKRDWKVVTIASSNYEYSVTLLLDRDRTGSMLLTETKANVDYVITN